MPSEQVEQVYHFEYLDSTISSDGRADKAVRARISKTRIAMLRLIPALVSKRLTLRNKGLLIETFLKPVLIYDFETLVIGCTDLGRVEAVVNRAKRIFKARKEKRGTKTRGIQWNGETTTVAIQLCKRKVQLYDSFRNIVVDSINDVLESAKFWQKDWVRKLRVDPDNHGLTTEGDQDNFCTIRQPNLSSQLGNFKANALGERSETVQCAD